VLRSGIGPEAIVVVYLGLSHLPATCAFWRQKVHGHRNVGLLDGDNQKWLGENRGTRSDAPSIAPADYSVPAPAWRLRARRDGVRDYERSWTGGSNRDPVRIE